MGNCVVGFFIVVNCVVLFCDFIELELFGYMKGVFIGVDSDCLGCVEIVDGGMFFFDEIGDLLLEL